MRPICATCKREMVPVENDFLVRDKDSGGFPSTYHYGDVYECPSCRCRIVTGFGKGMEAGQVGSRAKYALEFIR